MRRTPFALLVFASTATATPVANPSIAFGTPTTSGALDPGAVATVVKASTDRLLACYRRALTKFPGLTAVVTATFTIGSDGKVAKASAPGLDPAADACVVATITTLVFGKPTDGQPSDVQFPLSFDPGRPPTATITGASVTGRDLEEVLGGLIGNDHEPHAPITSPRIPGGRLAPLGHRSSSKAGSEPGPARATKFGEPAIKGELDGAIVRRYVRRNGQSITTCYEKGLDSKPGLAGTLIAAFTIDVDGKVSASTATGLKNPGVEACVADLIRATAFPKPPRGDVQVRYPITFAPPPPPARPSP